MNKMTPKYSTVTFNDMYEKAEDFIADYKSVGIPALLKEENITTLYYLLYSRYANNPIANRDINQAKYKIFSTIFQYGPTWEKQLDIQSRIRGLTEDEIMKGSKMIHNSADNPGTAPGTAGLDELTYINAQTTTNYKKSKLEGYSELWSMLETDVTKNFLDKFRHIFKNFVAAEHPILYYDDAEVDE